MQTDIILERRSVNRLNPDITKRKLRELKDIVERDNSQFGMQARISKLKEPEKLLDADSEKPLWLYRVTFRLSKMNGQIRDLQAAEKQLQYIASLIGQKASNENWSVVDLKTSVVGSHAQDVEPPPQKIPEQNITKEFVVPDLTEEAWVTFFGSIYERDPHIRMMHDSAKAFQLSGGETKSHVLLYGPPAGGKTRLGMQFKEFYENNSDREIIAVIDGPTMSKAGLENWLLEHAGRMTLPPIVFIEEVEKQDLDNLLTLLSMMASGYVAKLNARVGRVMAQAPSLVWATCNDIEVLRKFRRGALLSRFDTKLYCKRPGRELMPKILADRVRTLNGDPAWVDEVMRFVYETIPQELGETLEDPREILGMLKGRERLMDGSYQQDQLDVLRVAKDNFVASSDELVANGYGF